MSQGFSRFQKPSQDGQVEPLTRVGENGRGGDPTFGAWHMAPRRPARDDKGPWTAMFYSHGNSSQKVDKVACAKCGALFQLAIRPRADPARARHLQTPEQKSRGSSGPSVLGFGALRARCALRVRIAMPRLALGQGPYSPDECVDMATVSGQLRRAALCPVSPGLACCVDFLIHFPRFGCAVTEQENGLCCARVLGAGELRSLRLFLVVTFASADP